jgi:hypothetical protein
MPLEVLEQVTIRTSRQICREQPLLPVRLRVAPLLRLCICSPIQVR